MLHEVLLTMIGHVGDVIGPKDATAPAGLPAALPPEVTPAGAPFIHHRLPLAPLGTAPFNTPARPATIFALKHTFPGLHPSEVTLVNRLAELGSIYQSLVGFVSTHVVVLAGETVGESVRLKAKRGLYIKAFAMGLEEVLDGYRTRVLHAEATVMAKPDTPLSFLVACFEQDQLVLPALLEIVRTVCERKLGGGALLSYVDELRNTGAPPLAAAMAVISQRVQRAWFQQLLAWIGHGITMDKHREFFIQPWSRLHGRGSQSSATVQISDLDSTVGSTLGASSIQGLGAPVTAGPLSPWTGDSATKKQGRKSGGGGGDLVATPNGGVDGDEPSSSPSNNTSEPSSVSSEPPVVAPQWGPGLQAHEVDASALPSWLSARIGEKILFIGKAVQVLSSGGYGNEARVSVLDVERRRWMEAVKNVMGSPERGSLELEIAVDRIRSVAAEMLWRVVVVDGKLGAHLRVMSDYFLVGRGDFWRVFLDEAASVLSGPLPGGSAGPGTGLWEVAVPFQAAAGKSTAEYDELFSGLTLGVRAGSAVSSGVDDPWYGLELAYDAPWPANLIVTPEAVKRYNGLFQFLLYVKRTQVTLQRAWAAQMGRVKSDPNPVIGALGHVRLEMAFVIDNLEHYVREDVLETQRQKLKVAIESEQDFESVAKAHEAFLSAVENQCFVHVKAVRGALASIFRTVRGFCGAVVVGNDAAATSAGEEFRRQSSFLFRLLSSVRGQESAPHLSQFLLRLDYNRWMTNL